MREHWGGCMGSDPGCLLYNNIFTILLLKGSKVP